VRNKPTDLGWETDPTEAYFCFGDAGDSDGSSGSGDVDIDTSNTAPSDEGVTADAPSVGPGGVEGGPNSGGFGGFGPDLGGGFNTGLNTETLGLTVNAQTPSTLGLNNPFGGFNNSIHGTPGIASGFGYAGAPSVDVGGLNGPGPSGGLDNGGGDMGEPPQPILAAPPSVVAPVQQSLLNPVQPSVFERPMPGQVGYWQGNQFIYPRSLLG